MSVVEKAMDKLRASAASEPLPPAAPSASVPTEIRKRHPTAGPVPSGRIIKIDLPALRAAHLLPEPEKERRLADQYRRIKRPILDRASALRVRAAPGAQFFMVASALAGDGKTFTSINLALSIARERDVSLLLVDADVAKPHISRLFGVDKEPGLMDALGDDSLDVEQCILATDIPGLSLLPAGRRQESATELLASARMAVVLTHLTMGDPRRLALFDSPPLLLSSESRAIAQQVGQLVLVVRAGVSPQAAVLDALGHIDKEKLTGLVLNQSDTVSSDQYYGHKSYGEEGHAN